MRNKINFSIILTILVISFLISGCSFFGIEQITDDMIEDVEELQSLLSIIEATSTLAPADSTNEVRTIANDTYFDGGSISGTPAVFFAAESPSGVEIRYPATADTYMIDFYSDGNGNEAYMLMSKESADLYRIKLYIYPALSTSVSYIYEEYYVGPGNWAIVDQDGTEDPTAYISLRTYYFNNTYDVRTVVSNSTATTDPVSYSAVSVPELTSDESLYNYPGTITAPATGASEYSAYVTGEIFKTKDDTSKNTLFTEFYTETSYNPDLYSSLTYISRDLKNKTERTVQRSEATTEGIRIRSKTVSIDTRKTVIVYESIDITTNDIGNRVYTFNQIKNENGIDSRTQDMVLIETDTANEYSGTMTKENHKKNKIIDYTVTLTTDGLVITKVGIRSIGDMYSITDIGDRISDKSIQITLSNGGVFLGTQEGNSLSGTYTSGSVVADVVVDKASIEIETATAHVIQ